MRKIYLLLLFFLFALPTFSQRHGNEWISHSQTYVKFPLQKEGIYRIDSAALAPHFDLLTANAANFQLFLKGKELSVYVSGGADNQINNGDYLEFYANPLPGTVDSLIYNNTSYQPNPFFPMFNDTVYAFLTLANSPGKRFTLESDTNSLQYPFAQYFYARKTFFNHNGFLDYNPDDLYQEQISDPNYTQAEGTGMRMFKGTTISTPYNLLNYTATALPFQVAVNYSGRSRSDITNPDHQVQLRYSDQGGNEVLLYDTTFYGFAPVRRRFALNAQDVGTASNFSFSSVANPSFSAFQNNTLLHYISLFYPHQLNLEGQTSFALHFDNATAANKQSYFMGNFPTAGATEAVLLDLTNNRKIATNIIGNAVLAVVPNGVSRAAAYISLDNAIVNISNLRKVNGNGQFVNYYNTSSKKPYVIIYHPLLQASANTYANYRRSPAGGSHEVMLVNINHLYEQFCYGINKHPLAIKNFARYLQDTLPQGAGYFLLLGKSISTSALFAVNQSQNLVPTMGRPVNSDNLLTAALTQSNTHAPEIPIGRVSALTNNEVIIYLDKVKQVESAVDVDWKKRVLHFVGGDSEQLSAQLSQYMSNYEQVIRDTLFGAEVITFKKNTTAPIQTHISDSIKTAINYGASLLNFFGHGSEEGFDHAIDDPQLFENAGRYPFVIANSCYSGNIHEFNRRSVSERFALANQKGSIGFLATTSFGFDNALNQFTQNFYRAIAARAYNMGIGDVIKDAAIQNSFSGGFAPIVGLDMTLEGDPAIVISNGEKPDYRISSNQVWFDLKTRSDSIGIKVLAWNGGKAIKDSIGFKVIRYFPDGDTAAIEKKIRAPFYRDTITLNMFLDFNRGIGLNKFSLMIESYNRIDEKNEVNNNAGLVELFVPGGDIHPVYPYRFAIVPKKEKIILKSSTSDPFAPLTVYRLQLDTNDRFLSPLSSTLISSKGGVIEWEVNLNLPDSTVYFWRVSRDSISPEKSFVWRESSFQTIGQKRGWSQAHFNQYKTDEYRFVSYKPGLRKFVFENTRHSVMARTGVKPYIHESYINSYFDNLILGGWPAQVNGWSFALFDSISGQPVKAVATGSSNFGQFNNCVAQGKVNVFSFGQFADCGGVPTWKADMENFLNWIPTGMYVLGYNVPYSKPWAHHSSYTNSLYEAFESLGVGQIRTAPDSAGYAFFGRKGLNPGQANEKLGTSDKEIVYVHDTITTAWNSGYIASPLIGPSFRWESLHWRHASTDAGAGDTLVLKIVGIRSNGQVDTLGTLKQDSLNISDLSQLADAGIYPWLRLVAYMRDNVFRTSPQLKSWQVIYEEAPECAINPLKGFAALNDVLQEGDKVQYRFPIENIGEKEFRDSLLITYWLENAAKNKVPLPDRIKRAGFKPGELIIDTLLVNSYLLRGNNTLWMYVNPQGHNRYQHEQQQFNNIATHSFAVSADVTNPLLDVTFDGVRILNGDIVSAKPEILISLKDENKFLALNDTAAFTVLLSRPGMPAQRVYFARDLVFTPASLPKNSATILYRPALEQDGRYSLSVNARDRSNNSAGTNDYRIDFEVDNKPAITNVVNYPNPFSTSTRFVFTLTGSEVPEVFTIQIITVSGKLVKEITRAELGTIRVGRNITEYAWDGRDNFGDRLANGVYLYRVVTRLNGQQIEKRQSGADQFFTREFGKMVIMR